ncbi:elongation of very long chain fatty acids protein AAEL008004-like [Toxorhynchites rutilus septentrionalis]|uniref:elongation of very long chain fatty acids protein AAEL008004-like n=1 Tax=Toxorhynchites rutilus septentrionalis TaxID=329112 RepID=UPI0024797474|nr:elongation of very long chain fatty acids protein AAEL008004-like [Toxorhynchites rutilus septentrionalis]
MAFVLLRSVDEFQRFLVDYRDKRSSNFPLIGSPWPVLTIVAVYLYIVLKAGPKYMEQRKAFNLKNIIRAYNVVQVFANGAFFIKIIFLLSQRSNFSFSCQPVDYSESKEGLEELYLSYAYFILKVLDLIDTVFFVLRKKQSHVSFLHVYHHSMMVVVSYLAVIFVPGGHVVMLGIWNTLVHAVMYFYYYLSSYGRQNTEWWKKHLTRLQLLQFIHLGIHFGIPALFGAECNFPRFWHWLGFLQAIFVLTMFLDFYIKSYVTKARKCTKKT